MRPLHCALLSLPCLWWRSWIENESLPGEVTDVYSATATREIIFQEQCLHA